MHIYTKSFALSLLLTTLACASVHSAEIRETNDKLCAFRLEGIISVGDYDTLFQMLRRNLDRLNDLDERTKTICLNSEGGSYDEALKISELAYNHGISTLIEYNSRCFSACAIIFMAGVISSDDLRPIMPYRKLSAGGVLGFHAPYISISNGKYSKEHVENAAQAMRAAILGLARLSSRQTSLSSSDFLKKSLIVQVLEKGPQELFFVKTIGEAVRWDIEIYDAAEQLPKPNSVDSIKNLCNNFHHGNMDEPVPVTPDFLLKTESYASKFRKENFRVLVLDRKTEDIACEIYLLPEKWDPWVSYHACSYDLWSHRNFGDCRDYKAAVFPGKFVPSFFTLAPETALKVVP